MSPGGHAALAEEARRLWQEERPRVVEVVSWAASLGDRSENADYQYGKRRLREIDRRLRFLRKRLDRAQVVDPARPARRDRVFFGATVTYADESDRHTTVTIVGADEAVGVGEVEGRRPIPLGGHGTLFRHALVDVLDLFLNRVAEVGGLADAPLLQELQLGANPVTDLTPLLRVGTLVNLGLDETDAAEGRISYAAPVARALLGASVGDLVRLRTPGGAEELEVLSIRYPDPPP